MYKLIREDNKEIEHYVSALDSKIAKLKEEKKLPTEYLKAIHTLYLEAVIPWMNDYQFPNREPNEKQQEIIIDRLLDFYNFLDSISD